MPAVKLLYHYAMDALESSSQRVAVINAHADPLLKNIASQCKTLTLRQQFRDEYDALLRLGLNCSQTLDDEYELILLLPAKNRLQTLGQMAEAMRNLVEGGKVIVACANKHGAKSYAASLKILAGNSSSSSKSKCRIFSAKKGDGFNVELAGQWMKSAAPRIIKAHGLLSQPGLFSWDRADAGSELLLKYLPDRLSGVGMDLCCGYGFLTLHLLNDDVDIKTLHLIEADRVALNCAEANMQKWQEKIQSHWLDAAAGLPLSVKFDWIVCNPPFHSGHEQDISLGQSIIANGCKSLKRGGKLYLVANRKLPYEATLERMLMRHKILTQEQGFKVIEATKGAVTS